MKVLTKNFKPDLNNLNCVLSQPLLARDDYEFGNEVCIIPTVFMKINGTQKKATKYEDFVKPMLKHKNTIFYKNKIGFSTVELSMANKNDYDKDVLFDPEKFHKEFGDEQPFYLLNSKNICNHHVFGYEIAHKFFTFNLLTRSKQDLIVSILSEIMQENEDNYDRNDFERLISSALSLPENIVTLINNYDYKGDVPKIIYACEDYLSKIEFFLFLLLNKIGFDVIFLAPSGKNIVEPYYDIDSYSLGYYDNNIDFGKMTASKNKKVKKIFKSIGENVLDKLKDIWSLIDDNKIFVFAWVCAFINVLIYILGFSGTIKTIVQIISVIVLIVVCFISEEELDYSASFTSGVFAFIIGVLLCGRGLYWAVAYDTPTEDGYQVISEDVIENDNGFFIHLKNDAVVKDGSKYVTCYIENNADNNTDCYFRLYIGNSEICKSYQIKPLQYVTTFSSNCTFPVGDTLVTVKYFVYDSDNREYTDELLGESQFYVHCVELSDYNDTLKEYNYN